MIDAGNRVRDMMRNNQNKGRRDQTGGAATHPVAAPPVYTPEQRETVRQGLRILTKIIARAHLRLQAVRTSAAAPGPPPEGAAGEWAILESAAQTDRCPLQSKYPVKYYSRIWAKAATAEEGRWATRTSLRHIRRPRSI